MPEAVGQDLRFAGRQVCGEHDGEQLRIDVVLVIGLSEPAPLTAFQGPIRRADRALETALTFGVPGTFDSLRSRCTQASCGPRHRAPPRQALSRAHQPTGVQWGHRAMTATPVRPPSTSMTLPLTKHDSSEAR
jgi:hypothetical protein